MLSATRSVRFACLLLISCTVCIVAEPPPAGSASLGDSLRLDPAVRTGTLSNGMRYFIRKNAKPEARVSLRLAVAAGSTAEADDQQGLAHFVEHMNFNGSKHFKPDELVSYLRSIGMRFGADANAYTRFDETVYMLEVPTDRESLLTRGLDVLSDFAGGATMSDVEVAKERGVVMEEWRLGQGAWERFLRKQVPVLYHGSRYAERLPIGKPEIIEKAPASRLRDFYRDWYTPDRMAVVAVGDVDPARMDSLIRAHFSGLAPNPHPRPTVAPDVPLHRETLISVATDREATNTQVSVLFKHPRLPSGTVGDYRRDLIETLFQSMVNARLSEVAHAGDAPFLWAGSFGSALGKKTEYYGLSAAVVPGGIQRGLSALLAESMRVQQHGFVPAELERAKSELLADNERAYAERDKSESSAFASRYVQYALDGDPAPGTETTHRLAKELVPGIGLDEVTALSRRLVHEDSRVVLATAPDKEGTPVPSEDSLRVVLERSGHTSVAAWQDKIAGKTLMAKLPEPGRVRSQRKIDEIGVTVLTLSNGAEVWLKPTDFKADEVLFDSFAPGGGSLADSARYGTAGLSASIVSDGGVGGFTGVELQKLLAGKIASANPYLDDYLQGVSGSCRPEDLETALQLVHLTFTRPTEDAEGFTVFKRRMTSWLADRANSPDAVFQDTLTAVNTGNFYMDRPPTVSQIETLSLKEALDFYRARFANAADFTFFFVGTFDVAKITPLIERYLGSLPSAGAKRSAFVPRVPTFPAGVRTARVVKGLEPKSSTRISFFADPGLEELELHRLRAAASILTDRLRQILREDLGGTYSVSVGYSGREPARGYGTMSVSFGSSPANVERMVAATMAEIERLRKEGPSEEDVKKQMEVERRELEVAMKRNGYWLGSLRFVQLAGWDPGRIAHRFERIERLTAENLHPMFSKYFPAERRTVVSLFPEQEDGRAAGH